MRPARHVRRHRSLLMYAGDNVGLGHLRRCVRIASRLVRELPGTQALVLTGLPLGCPFELPAGVDAVKLPSFRKVRAGRFEPRTLTMDSRELTSLRTDLIRSVVRALRPDLFLVDHLPIGVSGELLPVLRELKRSTRVVLGLRDIVDDPGVTRRIWREQGVFDAIDRFYDEILIYGSPEVFDAASQYRLDREVRTPVHYCGYVCSDEVGEGAPDSRGSGSCVGRRRVVVTAGGGSDGYPMMRKCVDALRYASGRIPLDSVFVTGPFMPRECRESLEAAVRGLHARVLWRVEAVPDLLETADVVMTMAGYNTLVEAIRLGKRPLVIPRKGPSAEQRMRSAIFAGMGLVRMGYPEVPSSLARLVLECIDDVAPRGLRLDTDGLSAAVARLGTLLESGPAARRATPSAFTTPVGSLRS